METTQVYYDPFCPRTTPHRPLRCPRSPLCSSRALTQVPALRPPPTGQSQLNNNTARGTAPQRLRRHLPECDPSEPSTRPASACPPCSLPARNLKCPLVRPPRPHLEPHVLAALRAPRQVLALVRRPVHPQVRIGTNEQNLQKRPPLRARSARLLNNVQANPRLPGTSSRTIRWSHKGVFWRHDSNYRRIPRTAFLPHSTVCTQTSVRLLLIARLVFTKLGPTFYFSASASFADSDVEPGTCSARGTSKVSQYAASIRCSRVCR